MKQSSISFLVTSEEFELLAAIVYLEPFLDDILSKVKREDGELRLKFPYDDLEDAISALDHHAGYEDDFSRRQQLQVLAKRLDGYKLCIYQPTSST